MLSHLRYFKYQALNSFWFTPSLMWLFALFMAGITLWADHAGLGAAFLSPLPFFDVDADGARAILSTIAGSLITVTSLVFSLTLVTLTMASSQLGPRLIGKFISDRLVQFTLGSYVSTFSYALIVLRSVAGGEEAFVPVLSLHFAILGTLFCFGLLIAFIHHVAIIIQADWVIFSVADDLLNAMPRAFPEEKSDEESRSAARAKEESTLKALSDLAPLPVKAEKSGYVQTLSPGPLAEIAERRDSFIRLLYRPGHYIVAGSTIAYGGPAIEEGDHEKIRAALVLGPKRSAAQDIEFAVTALVEIALRALSPGINDPRTAIACIDWLTAAAGRAMQGEAPPALLCDKEDTPRLWRDIVSFEGFIDCAFNEIRQAARDNVAVTLRLIESITRLGEFIRTDEHWQVLSTQANKIESSLETYFAESSDTDDLLQRLSELRKSLETARPAHKHLA